MKRQTLVLDPGTANFRAGLAIDASGPKIKNIELKNGVSRKGASNPETFEHNVVGALQTADVKPAETNVLTSVSTRNFILYFGIF